MCRGLGGGVWKKRLDKNRHRAIVLTKVDGYWVYAYLFATKKLSGDYQSADIDRMLNNADLHEICKDKKEE